MFRERCYDDEPDRPWEHKARFSKTALTEEQEVKRRKFGEAAQRKGHTDAWYLKNVNGLVQLHPARDGEGGP